MFTKSQKTSFKKHKSVVTQFSAHNGFIAVDVYGNFIDCAKTAFGLNRAI